MLHELADLIHIPTAHSCKIVYTHTHLLGYMSLWNKIDLQSPILSHALSPNDSFWALCIEDRLEIKRRSWEARMTQIGKKETQVGP